MSISLNNVNSEVVRAHTRIDGIANSVGAGFPNYSKGEARNLGTTYTAQTDGFVWLGNTWDQASREWRLTIAGQELGGWGSDAAWGTIRTFFPIPKGVTYSCRNIRGGGLTMKWFPAIK